MLRHSLVLAALLATSLISANGCRSCSSCHDYDPPVANCNCGPYGPQGGCNGGCCGCGGCSSCGCSGGGCSSGGCSGGGCSGSGCGCGGGSASTGTAYSQQGQMAEPAPTSADQSVGPMGEQSGM